MGKFSFCQVGDVGFFLIILLSLNLCDGNNHVTIKCADCTPIGVRVISPDASSGRRLVVAAGNLKLINGGDLCASYPGKIVQNVLSMISNTLNNFKQEAKTMIRKLMNKISTISWPFHSKNEELIDIPPSPGNSFEFPVSRLLNAFLSPKLLGRLMEVFHASVKKNFIISRKLLTVPGFPWSPQLAPHPPPQYSQRLIPSTAPTPMVTEPHYLIPGPAFPPIPPSGPTILQKQKPLPPPVPTFKKAAPPHRNPPVSVQQPPTVTLMPPISSNPTKPPPVLKSGKPVPPPLQSQQQTAPVYPPVSPPISMSHPPVKPVHNSAPSPLYALNPNPSPRKKTFYPIPKAPPIPHLPPVPKVPRRYFNFPKYGSQPSSPPS